MHIYATRKKNMESDYMNPMKTCRAISLFRLSMTSTLLNSNANGTKYHYHRKNKAMFISQYSQNNVSFSPLDLQTLPT